MRTLHLITAAALLASTAAYAAPSWEKKEPPKTRAEAIERAKEHVSKLEKMSDQQWLDARKESVDRREKRMMEKKAKKGPEKVQ